MSTYEFEIHVALPKNVAIDFDIADRLFRAGCDDCVLGHGRPGRLTLMVDRAAESAEEAINSVLDNLAVAVPGASALEVTPDIVGLTDLAEIVGRTRQNMRVLLLGTTEAPAPMHVGSTALWHLAPVLEWLSAEKDYQIDPCLLQTARAAMRANALIGCRTAGLQVLLQPRRLMARRPRRRAPRRGYGSRGTPTSRRR